MNISTNGYKLVERFADERTCLQLISATNMLVKEQYTKENIHLHAAYPSDESVARRSYAFSVSYPGGSVTADLPALPFNELAPELQHVTKQAVQALGVDSGRTLFNVQQYYQGNKEVTLHFDGEFFEYETNVDGSFNVLFGLRSARVAVLTLKNLTEGGGTTLCAEGATSGLTISAKAGDLLIFDNIRFRHAVKPMTSSLNATSEIRYTIGWRALDQGCYTVRDGVTTMPLTLQEAAITHRAFLPKRQASIKYKPPF